MQPQTLQQVQHANASITATGVDPLIAGALSEKSLIGYDTAIYGAGAKLESKKLFSENKGAKLAEAFQNLQFPIKNGGVVIQAIQAIPMVNFATTTNGETASSANEAFFSFIINSRVVITKNTTAVFTTPLHNILPYNVAYNPVADTLSFFQKLTPFTRLPEEIKIGTEDCVIEIIPPEGVTLNTAAAGATNPHLPPSLDNTLLAASTGRGFYVKVYLAYVKTNLAQVV